MKIYRNIVIAQVVLLAIVVVIGAWFTTSYDERAEEPGLSKAFRTQWYRFLDDRQERIILAPEDKSLPDPFADFPNLTEDWFTKKSPAWEVALAEFKGKPNLRYLEAGAYEGRSVVWMLRNVLTDPTSKATVIDLFYDMGVKGYSADLQRRYQANIDQSGSPEKVTTMVGFSQVEMRKLPLDYYDIIYIDGSHFAPDVLEDAILAFRLLKPGGILIFDDYRWWMGAPKLKTPKYAVDTFIDFNRDYLEVLHNEYQVILRKVEKDNIDSGMVVAPATAAAD